MFDEVLQWTEGSGSEMWQEQQHAAAAHRAATMVDEGHGERGDALQLLCVPNWREEKILMFQFNWREKIRKILN